MGTKGEEMCQKHSEVEKKKKKKASVRGEEVNCDDKRAFQEEKSHQLG